MTLIVIGANDERIVVAADRRVTATDPSANGEVLHDHHCKVAMLATDMGFYVVTFTGYAWHGNVQAIHESGIPPSGEFGTHDWICSVLVSSCTDRSRHLGWVALHLAEQATARFDQPPLDQLDPKPRLSVAMVGYEGPATDKQVVGYTVTNRPGTEIVSEFVVVPMKLNPRPQLHVLGSTYAVKQDARAAMLELLDDGRPLDALVGKAVDMIRLAADDGAAKGTIGKNIDVVSLTPSSGDAPAYYYPESAEWKALRLSFVTSTTTRGAWIMTGMQSWHSTDPNDVSQFAALPPTRRDDQCWCGSGRKRKVCHPAPPLGRAPKRPKPKR